jgi:S-adenosylmethionine:tRNA ribosyltransferase-isomerase
MLRTADLDYVLPEELVATRPAGASDGRRDGSRMLVVRRNRVGSTPDDGSAPLEDRAVSDLPLILRAGDLVVVNSSGVLPARLVGRKLGTNDQDRGQPGMGSGRVEGLFIEGVLDDRMDPSVGACWKVLLRGKRLRTGTAVELLSPSGEARMRLELLEQTRDTPEGDGASMWVVSVRPLLQVPAGVGHASDDSPTWLDRVGHTPLPPYIVKRRKLEAQETTDSQDRAWYQTVYAREVGSVAAPTAGLHFTPDLLSRLQIAGVRRAEVVLHVGLGTFRSVQAEFVEEHRMHAEWARVPRATLEAIEQTRHEGGRVIAVGTTAARTLESFAEGDPSESTTRSVDSWFQTRLLITPGRPWRVVDGLLTNFHLPRTTLLALVAGLIDPREASDADQPPPGVERLLEAYRHAVAGRYRFFSYGDAMLVVP